MRRATALALAISLLGGCRGGRTEEVRVADPASRRPTTSGEVVGFVGRYGSFVWMGIPFAAPPAGEHRWRAPAAPAAWTGVREAIAPGSACVQYASPFGGVTTAKVNTAVGSEDCLYLNVWAPRTATPASRLPVMVWIHGGGNSIGAGSFYDGGNLATLRDVVVVSMNYRLGPFGWFRHEAIRASATSDVERSGNFGTLDLVRALEWVRDNVAAFGGDPSRVTIFGESAGGMNVLSLLLSPQARGLFQRAIVESAGVRMADPVLAEASADGPSPVANNSSNEALARLWVRDGRATDRADAKARLATTAPAEIAGYLRAEDALKLLEAYQPLPGIGMIRMPLVFADGTVLPSDGPVERLRRADGWNRVPVMIGTNRDENKLFMFGDPRWVRWWLWILPRLRDPERYDVTAEIMSKMWKANGADQLATAMRASGAANVYVYRFDWDEESTPLGTDLPRMLGACHGFEIPFVFDHFDFGRDGRALFTEANEPGRKELSTAMTSYWTAFAATGDPGRGRDGALPEWPAWSAPPRFMVLDTTAGGGVRTSPDTVTRESVLALVESDPRLPTPRDRCMIYHDLVDWTDAMTRASYEAKCPDLPFDGYPWGS
ncbi:MAG TPA: carboxylesterase family protein [Candidatus Eisenbacteria bacterium]|nr:carboxylesterase family protein [Candidatus Eisenbacteria bacterium]